MVDIHTNLLKHRQTLSEKDYQRERQTLRWAVMGMVIVVTVVAALAVWDLVLSNQLGVTKKEVASLNSRMEGLVTASAQQIYLKSRLKLVTGFLSDRSLVREGLQRVFSTNIPGTHISGVSFLTPIVMSLQVQADSVNTLNDALTYYQADAGYFTQVVSRGLSRSKDGNYQLSLELTLPSGAKP